jgi:hypothetical protein
LSELRLAPSHLAPHFIPSSHGYARVAPGRGGQLVLKELAESGKLCPVIDREYPLREAVRYVGSGQARAKVVINVS